MATPIYQGYLEKKKRKALQGYAKRYFVLEASGILSYSQKQGEKTRDSVDLRKASIGRSKKRRHIVIDALDKDQAPWHCKALSDSDYDKWTAAFHNFSQVKESETKSASDALSKDGSVAAINPGAGSGAAASSVAAPVQQQEQLISSKNANDLVALLSQMTMSIRNLEKITEQVTGTAEPAQPEQAASTYSRLVSSVSSVTSSITGSTPQVNSAELIRSMDDLKDQHRRALSLLGQAHIVSDEHSLEHLQKAESIASADYHDAETGFAYDLDEVDTASGYSSDDSSSFYSSSGNDSGDDTSADEAEDETDASSVRSDRTAGGKDDVKRRHKLPHPVAGEEVSLFGLLKKNMGKDLSRISFPVTLNEPISALQTMAESMEYSELLDTAAKSKDSIERLLYVTAFAISTYAKYKYRSSRKPFNPLLGETYELVRPDKGFKFIAEKVVHHPNWTACFGTGRGWEYTSTTSGAQKFWGRSFELIPEGMSEVKLKDSDEVYSWTKPPSYVKNIMSGEKYIEHIGDMEVTNKETGERAVVSFKEGSSWGGASSRNKVEGKIYDSSDKVVNEISGRWDESISKKTGGKSSETLWQINDFPNDATKYYGFPLFAIQLNEITPDIKDTLPPTDSRLRPDQRAMEDGDVDTAENQKTQLEEKQRDRRKKWESASGDQKPPQFFKEVEEGVWHYSGNYWERREKKDWNKDIKIFEL